MAPLHMINTTAAHTDNCTNTKLLFNRAIFHEKNNRLSQNIFRSINAKANKYRQNHNQTILP